MYLLVCLCILIANNYLYILFPLCFSVYCLCVNVYCTTWYPVAVNKYIIKEDKIQPKGRFLQSTFFYNVETLNMDYKT